MKYPVIIIGGGLAGLVTSIELARKGIRVLLIERKSYPHHKVCGEYVSNEVRPYLEKLGLSLNGLGVSELTTFRFTSPAGKALEAPLPLGGFGVSRYALDHALYRVACDSGVEFLLETTVSGVDWKSGFFSLITATGDYYEAEVVVGAYGKRTRLDKTLHRDFMVKPSPYLAVKYHIQYDFPKNAIALHNFKNGYCGISAIENNAYCLCYLTERSMVKEYGGIQEMEQHVMSRNPHLNAIFKEASFLFEKPEVINEISFSAKKPIENHVLMAGDAAGLITPLCGNGMAMAIHAGLIGSTEIIRYFHIHKDRDQLEKLYSSKWNATFSRRLWVGRTVQHLFGHEVLSELTLSFFAKAPGLLQLIIRNTHGKTL